MSNNPDKPRDPLHQYATSVGTLHHKLGRIHANQHAVAGSLSRAAAALRSIAAARERK